MPLAVEVAIPKHIGGSLAGLYDVDYFYPNGSWAKAQEGTEVHLRALWQLEHPQDSSDRARVMKYLEGKK